MFLSRPHCSLFATSNLTSAQVHREGLETPWAHKTGRLEFTHRSNTSKDSIYSLCPYQKPLKIWMSVQTRLPWYIEKNSQFPVWSVALAHPTYSRTHTRGSSIPPPPPNKREPPPSVWELGAILSTWMQIFPQTQIGQDPFSSRLCSLQTNMQMVGAQVEEPQR